MTTRWTEFAKEQAHVWRLKAERPDKSDLNQTILSDLPLPRSALTEITRAETEALNVRQTNHQRQKAFLERTIKQGNDQIAILSEQPQKRAGGDSIRRRGSAKGARAP
jgi:polysaccharide export outer membrane protein